MSHGVEYCFERPEYLCQIFEHADDYDTFITHLNQKSDLQKAKDMGLKLIRLSRLRRFAC